MSSNPGQYNSTQNIKMKFEKTVNVQGLSKNTIMPQGQLNDNGRYKKKPMYQYESNTQMVIGKEMRSSSKQQLQ